MNLQELMAAEPRGDGRAAAGLLERLRGGGACFFLWGGGMALGEGVGPKAARGEAPSR